MITSMIDLNWLPHPILPGISRALVNKCSVINDPRGWLHSQCGIKDFKDCVHLYEIMTPDGEVHGGLTAKRALEMINANS